MLDAPPQDIKKIDLKHHFKLHYPKKTIFEFKTMKSDWKRRESQLPKSHVQYGKIQIRHWPKISCWPNQSLIKSVADQIGHWPNVVSPILNINNKYEYALSCAYLAPPPSIVYVFRLLSWPSEAPWVATFSNLKTCVVVAKQICNNSKNCVQKIFL